MNGRRDTEWAATVSLVTGATAGIGFVTARELAKRGGTVVLVGREEARGQEALARIRKESRNPWVSFQRADLSSQAEVRRLARNFAEAHARLDVLVNNAGGVFSSRRLSADGIEMTFALNHLGYFLLTNLLIECLRAAVADTGEARIVNVASRAHEGAVLDFDDLQMAQRYNFWRAYQRSKLANILFTYELARRLQGTGITANALHPGFVATRLGSSSWSGNGFLFRMLMKLAFRTAIGVEEGAETSVWAATAPELAGVSGKYLVRKAIQESSPASRDPAAQRRLWEVSEALTSGSFLQMTQPGAIPTARG